MDKKEDKKDKKGDKKGDKRGQREQGKRSEVEEEGARKNLSSIFDNNYNCKEQTHQGKNRKV